MTESILAKTIRHVCSVSVTSCKQFRTLSRNFVKLILLGYGFYFSELIGCLF